MSRTRKKSPAVGKEYWSRRASGKCSGAIPGRFSKKRTHRLERIEAKTSIKEQEVE